MARGRSGRSSWRIPRAIAPLVTITTASPPAWRAATVAQTRSRTSRRTSPDASATMLEPSLSTQVDISRLSLGATRAARPRRGCLERRARVELEHRAGDLHVVAGLEARVLERAD